MKRALISVTDKTGIVEFARGLKALGYLLISTGGTYRKLVEGGLEVTSIESFTGFDEILDGRVKTLNPKIHGGILYKRGNDLHRKTILEQEIESIDLVCVNHYQFEAAVARTVDEEEIIEEIDIGGPTLVRAAAKNFEDVAIVTSPGDYRRILGLLKADALDRVERKKLAAKAFALISAYDRAISDWFNGGDEGTESLILEQVKELSYGENPHQKAWLYRKQGSASLMDLEQLGGKEMSYNNYNDSYGALEVLRDFRDEAFFCAGIKHATICCAAAGESSADAYRKSYRNDPVSIFGGIVAFTGGVDAETAEELVKIFLEIVIAPSYSEEALEILRSKKNLRILRYGSLEFGSARSMRDLDGHVLVQERDGELVGELKAATVREATPKEMEDLLFALKIVKNIKSNAIVVARDREVLALCGGQTARIFAMKDALVNYAGKDFKGAVMASDAFFPFRDSVEAAGEVGISAVIQPGGSRNDQESIDYCNQVGMAMVLSGLRHFKH